MQTQMLKNGKNQRLPLDGGRVYQEPRVDQKRKARGK
jgi:hypothetical protein